jgi:hypothetical protein
MPLDVDVQGLGVTEVGRPPHLVDQGVAARRAGSSDACSDSSRLELLGPQLHRVAVDPYLVGIDVDLDRAAPEHLVGVGERPGSGDPPQLGADLATSSRIENGLVM